MDARQKRNKSYGFSERMRQLQDKRNLRYGCGQLKLLGISETDIVVRDREKQLSLLERKTEIEFCDRLKLQEECCVLERDR